MVASGDAMPPASWASSTSRGGRVARRVTSSLSSARSPTTAPRTVTCRNGRSASSSRLGQRGLVRAAEGDRAGTDQQGGELVATGLLGRDLAEPVLHDAIG